MINAIIWVDDCEPITWARYDTRARLWWVRGERRGSLERHVEVEASGPTLELALTTYAERWKAAKMPALPKAGR